MRPAGCVALVWALQPLSTAAQSPEPVAVLSADSVEMAEVFELRVQVPVPAGSMVFFPATVPSTGDVESFSPVDWRARRGPNGGATIELRYALIPFGMGNTALPQVDVITMPLEDEVDGQDIPGKVDRRRVGRAPADRSVYAHHHASDNLGGAGLLGG